MYKQTEEDTKKIQRPAILIDQQDKYYENVNPKAFTSVVKYQQRIQPKEEGK